MSKSLYSKDQAYLTNRLRRARAEAKLNQEDTAKLLGKTQSYISKVESGQRRLDVIELKKFAHIYKKDLNFFFKKD